MPNIFWNKSIDKYFLKQDNTQTMNHSLQLVFNLNHNIYRHVFVLKGYGTVYQSSTIFFLIFNVAKFFFAPLRQVHLLCGHEPVPAPACEYFVCIFLVPDTSLHNFPFPFKRHVKWNHEERRINLCTVRPLNTHENVGKSVGGVVRLPVCMRNSGTRVPMCVSV